MTFFFNLDNLEKESCNNSTTFMAILDTIYYKKLPNRRKGIKPVKLNMHGSSFILNLEPLLKLSDIDTIYIVQYIKLCAKRDYNMYKMFGVKTLDLSYYPDINLSAIKSNPLLQITKSEIHFKYE